MKEIDRGTLPVDALSSGGGISCFESSISCVTYEVIRCMKALVSVSVFSCCGFSSLNF